MEGRQGEIYGYYEGVPLLQHQQTIAQQHEQQVKLHRQQQRQQQQQEFSQQLQLPSNEYDWKHLDRSLRDRDVLAFFHHYGRWPLREELSRFEMDILQSFKPLKTSEPASSSASQLTHHIAQYTTDDRELGSSDEEKRAISEEDSPQAEITWYKTWDDDDVSYIFDTLLGMLAADRSERVREQVKWRIATSVTDKEAALFLIGGEQQRQAIASTIKVNQTRAPPWFLNLPPTETKRLIHWHCTIHGTKDEAARAFLYRCTSAEDAQQKLQYADRRKQVQQLLQAQVVQSVKPKPQRD